MASGAGSAVFETFRRIFALATGAASEAAELDLDASMADLGLDSIGVVNLVVQIEEEFDFVLSQELLLPEVFRSSASLWNALNPYLGGGVRSR